MGMLYRNSDLEVRFSLNMNVLIDGRDAKGLQPERGSARLPRPSPRSALAPLQHRMDKIDHRLEVLEGFIVAFLNLDRVIDIISYDDDPKAALMAEDLGREKSARASEADYVSPLPATGEGELSEVQVEAILNMRLRSCGVWKSWNFVASATP